MVLLKKWKTLAGDPDAGLLEHGELGRGLVTAVDRTGVFAGPADFDARQVCVVTLQVRLDNQEPFVVQVRQQLATPDLAQMVPDETFVAVRVDSTDHTRAVIDLSIPTPVVTVSSGGSSTAAGILAMGEPVTAVIVGSSPLYLKNTAGVAIYALKLTVLAEGRPPAQFDVGNPVPPEAAPLLFPGSRLPAKQMAATPDDIAIDWTAALAAASA